MADYNEQVERLWDEWIAGTKQESGNPADFIEWALSNRRLGLQPQDIRQVLRKRVTQALRQVKRWDEEGSFTYRAKQSVTLFDGDMATKHYFDTDKGGTHGLRQKSVKQRREAIAHDVYRAVCDVERMRKVHRQPELNFFPDFTDDVEEHRAAEQFDRDDGEDREEA